MNKDIIRELNDHARQSLSGCKVMITRGVQQLERLDDILLAVR